MIFNTSSFKELLVDVLTKRYGSKGRKTSIVFVSSQEIKDNDSFIRNNIKSYTEKRLNRRKQNKKIYTIAVSIKNYYLK